MVVVARGVPPGTTAGPGSAAAEAVVAAPLRPGVAAPPHPGVEVWLDRVSLGYPVRGGFVTVLEDLDLHLAPGECLAVVGPSGCGKSTLLHACAGLLAPVRGQVRVADGTAEGRVRPPRGGRAAYMFQNDLLLPWKSVMANAVFAAELAQRSRGWRPFRSGSREARVVVHRRARSLLCEFGLEDALQLYPHQLSGGMRQRVALARTLALGRGLILLDEPFGSLDALTRADLREWTARVMQTHRATWVLVTHDVDEAVRLADRVVVLGGRPAAIRGSVCVTPVRDRRGDGAGRLTEAGLRRAAAEVHRILALERTR